MNTDNYNGITKTKEWFERAIKEPTLQNFVVQYSVMLEEVMESLIALGLPYMELQQVINDLRQGNYTQYLEDTFYNLPNDHEKRIEFLDSMCDVTVTATGNCHMLNQDIIGAMGEVNKSNWSKFDENGNPIFNEFGKITKGPNYFKPDLTPFV